MLWTELRLWIAALAIVMGTGQGLVFAAPDHESEAAGRLPPPPFEAEWLPGYSAEHVAFAVGSSGKSILVYSRHEGVGKYKVYAASLSQ